MAQSAPWGLTPGGWEHRTQASAAPTLSPTAAHSRSERGEEARGWPSSSGPLPGVLTASGRLSDLTTRAATA